MHIAPNTCPCHNVMCMSIFVRCDCTREPPNQAKQVWTKKWISANSDRLIFVACCVFWSSECVRLSKTWPENTVDFAESVLKLWAFKAQTYRVKVVTACALLNDWTSRDDTDFCSAWTALNVIVFLSRIVYLYVMLYWMAYTCIYLITFQKHFDTCISFFFKTCIVRYFLIHVML